MKRGRSVEGRKVMREGKVLREEGEEGRKVWMEGRRGGDI